MRFSNFMFYEMAMRSGNNLALYTQPGFVVLFEPSWQWKKAFREQEMDYAENLVFGIMEMRDNTMYKTWEVDAVYAQQGYGPFTYLTAMSTVYPDGLSPTRIQTQLTPAAKRVWTEFYSGQGQKLVKPVPLEGAKHHEEPYLNYKYVINSPISTQPMIQKSNAFFKQDRTGEWKDLFLEMTNGLLKAKMSEIY